MLVSLNDSNLGGSRLNREMGEGWWRSTLNLNPEISAMAEETTVLVQLWADRKAVKVLCTCLTCRGNQKIQDYELGRKKAPRSVKIWTVWFNLKGKPRKQGGDYREGRGSYEQGGENTHLGCNCRSIPAYSPY